MKLFGLLCLVVAATPAFSATYILTVAGLGGEPDYEQRFTMLASDTDKILKTGGQTDRIVETLKGPDATRVKMEASLNRIASQAKPQDAFVLMMIGHGTFDGAEYKFNLPGPDISGTEIAGLLNKIPAGRQLVVDMTSCSGGATSELKKENRTVITATKSGTEKNATVFARYWVEALRDPAADVDKNETISALEAFQYAEKKTAQFYTEQKRLATEHPQIDDQQRASAFPLLKFGSASAVVTDPAKRELIAKKDDIENKIDALKYQKSLMAPADYTKQLTTLLLELSRTQAEIDK
ncbi:MAG TPA: hypothetical protein VHY84_24605 [Bryobacteraceae bacterium]|jgi:hypothetical protein|nr:hypothetical protein [Bryobacteraceae bacterium]